jgi:ABC-type lipoprotein export system ATPase subunit
MLGGMLPPTSGEIVFNGQKYSGLTDNELSALRGKKIGYIMQGHGLLPNFTALQNVAIPHFFNKWHSHPEGRANFLLDQAGIPHLSSQYSSQLSGGELRRVSIARALFNSK